MKDRQVLVSDWKSLTQHLHFDMRCKTNHSEFACWNTLWSIRDPISLPLIWRYAILQVMPKHYIFRLSYYCIVFRLVWYFATNNTVSTIMQFMLCEYLLYWLDRKHAPSAQVAANEECCVCKWTVCIIVVDGAKHSMYRVQRSEPTTLHVYKSSFQQL